MQIKIKKYDQVLNNVAEVFGQKMWYKKCICLLSNLGEREKEEEDGEEDEEEKEAWKSIKKKEINKIVGN